MGDTLTVLPPPLHPLSMALRASWWSVWLHVSWLLGAYFLAEHCSYGFYCSNRPLSFRNRGRKIPKVFGVNVPTCGWYTYVMLDSSIEFAELGF
jgi:hypothetical protein